MAKFNVGDQVQRVEPLQATYMKAGIVIRVIPDKEGALAFTQYDVNFQDRVAFRFYESQLILLPRPKSG